MVAHVLGSRSRKSQQKLLRWLSKFDIQFWCTDNYLTYQLLPRETHSIGKRFTQGIKHQNLNLRNKIKRLNRKT
ncbi:hypothetical protein HBA43_12070 [Providencia rettgeri]|nr:hypothetical protein [Providencia rettgeri]MBN6352910.1 hypothetical protein [Providencia rettgeri]NIA75336.1 hypothetical protein [Providencia rettgeri]NIA79139.1 hypothetical protein [Providencia rettgeri]NIB02441.1 hypothetical protein [Providencia rettgeri]